MTILHETESNARKTLVIFAVVLLYSFSMNIRKIIYCTIPDNGNPRKPGRIEYFARIYEIIKLKSIRELKSKKRFFEK